MHPAAPPTTSLRLDQVAGAVRRRWATALVVVLTGLGLGAAAASVAPVSYTAQSTVTVEGFDDGTDTAASAPDMPTELQALTSTAVVDQVSQELGTASADIKSALTVSNPDRSRVLEVSYRAATPEQAARGANAVATTYLELRQKRAHTQAAAEAATVRDRATSLRQKLAKAGPAHSALASAYGQQLATLEARLADFALLAEATGGRVTSQASSPPAPAGPSTPVYLAGGLMLGLAAAAAAAVLRDRLSRRARDGGLLSDRIGAPVVTGTRHASADDIVRTLALRLDLANRSAPLTIAVAGTPPTGLARELTELLRRQGARTRLVEAGTVSSRRVDKGWPRGAVTGNGIAVLAISEGLDTPLSATIASRCDLVLLTVTTGTALGRVDRFNALLQAAGRSVDGAVLLHRRHELCAATALDPLPATEATGTEETAPSPRASSGARPSTALNLKGA